MISIPRDLYGTPLGDGRVYDAKLNSLMSTAAADRTTYPLGGPATLKAAIGELLGTRIHYFAAIDIEGLREVTVTPPRVSITRTKPPRLTVAYMSISMPSSAPSASISTSPPVPSEPGNWRGWMGP